MDDTLFIIPRGMWTIVRFFGRSCFLFIMFFRSEQMRRNEITNARLLPCESHIFVEGVGILSLTNRSAKISYRIGVILLDCYEK